MSKIILAAVSFLFLLGCNSTEFSSQGAQSTENKRSSGEDLKKDSESQESADVSSDASGTNTEASQSTDAGASEPKNVSSTVETVQSNVSLDICKPKPVALPGQITELKELYHWQSHDSFNQVMATPIAVPLKQDDTFSTILVVAFQGVHYHDEPGRLIAINGADGTELWRSSVEMAPSSTVAVADMNNDGNGEIAGIGADGRVVLIDANGKLIWRSDEAGWSLEGPKKIQGNRSAPAVADLDGDGRIEVVAELGIFDGGSGKKLHSLASGIGQAAATFDPDGSGSGQKVVNGRDIRNSDGSVFCSFPDNIFVEFSAVARLRKSDPSVTIIGLNGASRQKNGQVVGLNGNDCSLKFKTDMSSPGGGSVNIGDYDNDGELEFSIAARNKLVAFETDGSIKWQVDNHDFSSATTGTTSFDLNGDGKAEIIYNDEVYLKVFDAETGRIIYQTANSSGTLIENPIVVDVNHDGHANIVVAANDFNPELRSHHGIRVFQAPDNDWVATRKIWNQHAFDPLGISDELLVTRVDKPNLLQGALSSDYLAGFRNNIPLRQNLDECHDMAHHD